MWQSFLTGKAHIIQIFLTAPPTPASELKEKSLQASQSFNLKEPTALFYFGVEHGEGAVKQITLYICRNLLRAGALT